MLRSRPRRKSIELSMDALWLKCGVSRDMISRIEGGESIPFSRLANLTNLDD